jgi:hypothetical protein
LPSERERSTEEQAEIIEMKIRLNDKYLPVA